MLKSHKSLLLDQIKAFFKQLFDQKKEKIKQQKLEISKTDAQLKERQEQLILLKTQSKIVQQNKCSECQEKMSHPQVYFICGHLFHSRCIEGRVCPICDLQNQQTLDNKGIFMKERIGEGKMASSEYNFESLVQKIGICKF